MATVLGIRCDDGAVLAGDRQATVGGTVRSDAVRRVFDYDDAGAALVGDVGAIEEFDRRVGSELRRERLDSDEPPSMERIERIAADLAGEVGVDGLVAGTDSNGNAALREIGSDGLVLATDATAVGSGAAVAYGRLEDADEGASVDDIEALARETLAVVAERDTDTGDDIDVLRFEGTA
ncbi:20S proteasome subunit A/B [Haladaptatus sp. DYF46]|uniref:20S proteasome subunit A/B n=1 Tax=Haladaptatus sp. DYF46 TaxID=2886041 RepID=UPI001E5B1F1C|nr:20S proteasome subunit A/B [Haladaptatus sp. DYF46]